LSLDVFQSETDKLLLRQAALGFSGVPQTWNNIGKLQTNGIELQLVTSNINKKKIRWTTQANISHNNNKVIELGAEAQLLNQGERNELYLNTIGAPLVQFFGYKTDGVWLSQAQIDAEKAKGLTSPLTNMFVPGGLKLVDVNGDNVIDVKDRTVIGNPYPDFSWGISNNFKIGNFDCSFTFQGVQGGELINGDGNYVEIKRTNNNYNANRWLSPLNPGDGKTPYSSNGFNWMLTDYVVEDASYYALREVNVGYTIPAAQLKKIKINGLRFYFSAQNLYYHFAKGYKGINPESSFSSGPYNTPLVDGYQRGAYPINKTFLVGVGFNF
jgi:TonB-dependent starch-binding outer membrane protein SusC